MQRRLSTYGSTDVADVVDRFLKGVRTFSIYSSSYEAVRTQGGQLAGEGIEMERAREDAREAMKSIERSVSEELASL